ncbi:hypothetical protein, partial [Salmonella sp. s58408]|uniref:hypothetical protein n=1 Tax=Salmonella sp. s58408 TaxID=3159701 RepID=UPI00398077A9
MFHDAYRGAQKSFTRPPFLRETVWRYFRTPLFFEESQRRKNQAGAVCTLSPPSPTTGKTVIIRSLVQNDNAPSHFLSKKNDKKR